MKELIQNSDSWVLLLPPFIFTVALWGVTGMSQRETLRPVVELELELKSSNSIQDSLHFTTLPRQEAPR